MGRMGERLKRYGKNVWVAFRWAFGFSILAVVHIPFVLAVGADWYAQMIFRKFGSESYMGKMWKRRPWNKPKLKLHNLESMARELDDWGIAGE